jgi:hypothetical protein
MSYPMRDQSWKTPELRAAEANLHAAVERGRATLARAQEVKAQIRPTPVSDADLRLIEQSARSADAPPALRALAERVDRGEFTWRQVVNGELMNDPGVRAAFQGNLDQMAQVYRKFDEGYTLDEVLESESGPDDDDDPDGGSVLRHSTW